MFDGQPEKVLRWIRNRARRIRQQKKEANALKAIKYFENIINKFLRQQAEEKIRSEETEQELNDKMETKSQDHIDEEAMPCNEDNQAFGKDKHTSAKGEHSNGINNKNPETLQKGKKDVINNNNINETLIKDDVIYNNNKQKTQSKNNYQKDWQRYKQKRSETETETIEESDEEIKEKGMSETDDNGGNTSSEISSQLTGSDDNYYYDTDTYGENYDDDISSSYEDESSFEEPESTIDSETEDLFWAWQVEETKYYQEKCKNPNIEIFPLNLSENDLLELIPNIGSLQICKTFVKPYVRKKLEEKWKRAISHLSVWSRKNGTHF